jgi:hypothetical protein
LVIFTGCPFLPEVGVDANTSEIVGSRAAQRNPT